MFKFLLLGSLLTSNSWAVEFSYFFNHLHTTESRDARKFQDKKFMKSYSPEELVEFKLDFVKTLNRSAFLAITDHNNLRAWEGLEPELHKYHPLKLLPAVEWGATHHLGLLGASAEWLENHKASAYKKDKMLEASEDGAAIRIVNHPTQLFIPWWTSKLWKGAEAVEVWNAPYDHSPVKTHFSGAGTALNYRALRMWHEYLKEGKSITALAGNDFHYKVGCLREALMHYPLNIVQGKLEKVEELYSKIKEGQVTLLLTPEAPAFFIEADVLNSQMQIVESLTQGQKSKQKAHALFLKIDINSEDIQKIRIKNACNERARLPKTQELEIRILDGSSEKELHSFAFDSRWSGQRFYFYQKPQKLESGFLRVEIWNPQKNEVIGISNPIYF